MLILKKKCTRFNVQRYVSRPEKEITISRLTPHKGHHSALKQEENFFTLLELQSLKALTTYGYILL